MIPAYGEKQSLGELCQIVSKSVISLQLSVFDEALIPVILKVLETSDNCFEVRKDRNQILVTLVGGNSKEQKLAVVKEIKETVERSKASLRQVRHQALEFVHFPLKSYPPD